MSAFRISDAEIRAHTSPESYERGQQYYDHDAVHNVVQRGSEVTAAVEGSQYTPYRVRLRFEGGALAEADCDCPYDWGGWCKHVVAVLLTLRHTGERVEERPPTEALLDTLDAAQLKDLLLFLDRRHPELADEIETWRMLHAGAPATPDAPSSVDPKPLQRRVRQALRALDHMRPSEAYWHVGSVVDEVRTLLDEVQAVLHRGAARDALVMLEAITQEYVGGWYELDDSNGEASAFFTELGPVWTEALLSAALSDQEGEHWAEKLNTWQDEVGDYGIDDAFYPAILAAGGTQGTHDTDDDLDDDLWAMYWADVDEARLNVLERNGDYDAFFELAEKMGRYDRFLTKLVELGRASEAVGIAGRVLERSHDAFALARSLMAHGHPNAALDVAERGLTLDTHPDRRALALWLRDEAERHGQRERALKAARLAFEIAPDLNAYRRVEALAGDAWPTLRADLLDHLRRQPLQRPTDTIEVYLSEGLVEDAIAIARQGYISHDTLRRVVDAAVEQQPEWAIVTARRQAEEIMDAGRSTYYSYAADWLRRVRDAMHQAGQDAEWRAYKAGLVEQHARKYKLRPMIEAL